MLIGKSNSLEEVVKLIKEANTISIVSHESPDPDAYGSSLALTLGLQSLGKTVECFNKDGVVGDLGFLPKVESIQTSAMPEDSDLYITTDSAGFSRLGKVYETFLFSKENTLNIDHHISNHFDAKYNYVEERASASEIVYEILKELRAEITRDMAELMLAGIYTDTGSLQFRGVKAVTFRIVAELVETGVTPVAISQKLFQEKPLNLLKLTAKLIENLQTDFDGQYAAVQVKPEWMEELGLNSDVLNYLKNFFRNIEGVKISALMRHEDNTWRVSLRSEEPYDVNKIAGVLGGGGHSQAAGIKWSGDYQELADKLSELVKAELAK